MYCEINIVQRLEKKNELRGKLWNHMKVRPYKFNGKALHISASFP